MNAEEAAYIAGFLDGDGSIHIQLIRQREYRYGFYLRVSVSFHQHQTGRSGLEWLKERLRVGYIRNRAGQMSDYVITSRPSIRELLKAVKPYAVFKQRQVQEALKLVDAIEEINSPKEFLAVARRIEAFAALNRSKHRTVTLQTVMDEWRDKGWLAPVTTDSAAGSADEIPDEAGSKRGSYASPSKEGGDIVYATSNRGQHA